MIAEKTETVEALELSAAKFSEVHDYGAETSRAWFENDWGVVYPDVATKKVFREIDGRFNIMLGKFKKFLLINHGKVLNVDGEPWHVLLPKDMPDHAKIVVLDRFKSALRYGNRVLEYTPADRLDDEGRKNLTDASCRFALLELVHKRVLDKKKLTDAEKAVRNQLPKPLKPTDAWAVMELCKQKGVKLKSRDGEIAYDAIPGAYTEQLRELVEEFKEEITSLLNKGAR